MRRRSRFVLPGLLPGLVLALTTACTASWAGGGSRPWSGGSPSSSFASGTSTSSSASGSGSAASSVSSSGSSAVSLVSCTGSSCSVTLGGAGASAQVLGVSLVFDRIDAGRASVRIGGTPVTCTEGERVSAGGLDLNCTRVTEDTVSFSGTR